MIKRALGLFWVIIILYFIFVHPAIIYYSTVNYSNLANRSGSTAIFYLILSITLWTGIFLLALYMIYKYSFSGAAEYWLHFKTRQKNKCGNH